MIGRGPDRSAARFLDAWPAHRRPWPAVSVCARTRTASVSSPLRQHPGVERRHRRAGLAHEIMDVFGDEGFRRQDDAAEAAALAIDVLGGGIHTTSAPSAQRLCQRRRCEHVCRRSAARRPHARSRQSPKYPAPSSVGFGRALQEAGPGVRPHRLFPLVEIKPIDQRGLDAVARQQVFHHIAAGAEHCFRRHHVVAGLQRPPSTAVVTAAIPVAVARAACAPSSSIMRRSNIETLGLEKKRE